MIFAMKLSHIPRSLAAGLVSLYQKTLSPDYGFPRVLFPHGFCPQHPTCSEYSKKMILERGMVIGGALAIKRVLSCHPWKKPSEEKLRKLAASQLR
jgi:putative component of membrane protein insertase Oxa1/YidC/SpoIIIJ protein YidD